MTIQNVKNDLSSKKHSLFLYFLALAFEFERNLRSVAASPVMLR